jgi:hypothetical protein
VTPSSPNASAPAARGIRRRLRALSNRWQSPGNRHGRAQRPGMPRAADGGTGRRRACRRPARKQRTRAAGARSRERGRGRRNSPRGPRAAVDSATLRRCASRIVRMSPGGWRTVVHQPLAVDQPLVRVSQVRDITGPVSRSRATVDPQRPRRPRSPGRTART